jgi:hypothetical protein
LFGDRPRALLGEIDVRRAETNRHEDNECKESQQGMQRLRAIIKQEKYYTIGGDRAGPHGTGGEVRRLVCFGEFGCFHRTKRRAWRCW